MGAKGQLHDKKGKNLRKRQMGLVEVAVYTPNVNTFKTTQMRLSGWVTPNPDATQEDYDRVMGSTKFRLKRMVRDWSESHRFFQPESIVDLDTSDVIPKSRKRQYQFFKVDIVLFVRDDLEYDKYFVTVTTEDIAERAIEILEQYPEYWGFTTNKNYEKEKQVDV